MANELDGRFPYLPVVLDDGRLGFRWIFLGDMRFSQPFFTETCLRAAGLPENSFMKMPITAADTVLEVAEAADSLEPSAFIYHISRCGSTMLTQQLCLDERFIVVSEAAVLDMVLRLPYQTHGLNIEASDRLFMALIKLLGRRQSGNETHLFIKADSWHTMLYDRIHSLYPEAASFLMSRKVDEVARSHKKQPGIHSVPGLIEPEIFGFTTHQYSGMLPEPYLLKVLDRYLAEYDTILAKDPNAFLLDYHDGIEAMLKAFVEKMGLTLSSEVWSSMMERATRHSKFPEQVFEGD